MLADLQRDLTLAVRGLARERTVTIVIVASLAIGIAANATVFSLVQAVEFPRLPYPDARAIVFFESRNQARGLSEMPVSAPDALEAAAALSSIDAPSLAADQISAIREAAAPVRYLGRQVSSTFFDVMQMSAARGRVLDPSDGAGAIVVSDRFWRTQLGGRADVIGMTLHLDDEVRTVLGVMPPRFDPDASYWVPLPDSAASANRDDRRFTLFARLRGEASMDELTRELEAVSRRMELEHPATNAGWTLFPTRLTRMHGQDSRGMFFLLQAAVVVVLLIACANIANILLARGTRRRHEMALRIALGAGRRRLVRQLLTESLLLAAMGGGIGLALTLWGIRLARALGGFPDAIDPTLNVVVLAFAAVTTIGTGLLAGVLSAVRVSAATPGDVLRTEGGRGGMERRGQGRLRTLLVAIQVASAVVLGTAAALLVQTMVHRQQRDLGFDSRRTVRADVALAGRRYADVASVRPAAEALLERIASRPDVAAVGASAWALSRGTGAELRLSRPGRDAVAIAANAPRAIEAVTPAYFEALGIPLRQGRAFGPADREGAPLVAVVNDEFARHGWPGESAVGQSLRLGAADEVAPIVTIVGVVGTIRRSAMHDAVVPRLYVPYAQFPGADITLVARARGEIAPVIAALQSAVRETDPLLVLDGLRTLEADTAAFLAPVRMLTLLFGGFGATALVLAGLGVFGTMSYAVAQRRREMAVRVALGAAPGDVTRLILRHGLVMATLGILPGALLAVVATRALGSFLYGVDPADPATIAAMAAGLLVICLASSYVPARAAASVDPMSILQRE